VESGFEPVTPGPTIKRGQAEVVRKGTSCMDGGINWKSMVVLSWFIILVAKASRLRSGGNFVHSMYACRVWGERWVFGGLNRTWEKKSEEDFF